MTEHWNQSPHLLPEAMTAAVSEAVSDAVARTEVDPWAQYGTQTWTATLTVSRTFTPPEGLPVANTAPQGNAVSQPLPAQALPAAPYALPAPPQGYRTEQEYPTAQDHPVPQGYGTPQDHYPAQPRYAAQQYHPAATVAAVVQQERPRPPIDLWTYDRDGVVHIEDPEPETTAAPLARWVPGAAPWDLQTQPVARRPVTTDLEPRRDLRAERRAAEHDLVRYEAAAPTTALTVTARPAPERPVYRDPAPVFHRPRSPFGLRVALTLAIALSFVIAGLRAHVTGFESPDNSTIAAHLPAFLGGAADSSAP